MSLRVEASLGADGRRLLVQYRVINEGRGPAYLLDDMLDFAPRGFARTPRALIVVEDDEAGLVRLVRGIVSPISSVAFILIPGARRLEAGAALSGEAETPLPLQARHPQDGPRPLRGERSRAVVEIGFLEGEPPMGRVPLEGGGEALLVQPAIALEFQQLARGEIIPL